MPVKSNNLLQPLQIKGVRLKNRMVKLAQDSLYPDDASVNERTKDFYEELALGGAALIVVESTMTDYPAALSGKDGKYLRIDDDKYIPGFANMVKVIHQHYCAVFLQLGHVGPSNPAHITGVQPIAASSLSGDQKPQEKDAVARALTIPEIETIVTKWSKGVERAKRAGFDGVEIHGGHSYLINSFLSRAYNKRQDEYGPQSFQSRAKFAVDILNAARQLVDPDFVIGIRFNGAEYGLKEGMTSEETQEFAQIFEAVGYDYINVTGFGYGPSSLHLLLLPEQIRYPEPEGAAIALAKMVKWPGVLVPPAAAIKKVVSIPVVALGSLDAERGERILREGWADLIGYGRALLADPELSKKVTEGRPEDIRPCMHCIQCLGCYDNQIPVVCQVNATLGREREFRIKSAEKKKKVLVVGAGPAGMEAARIAATRGHNVSLYDKEQKLGGLLPMAALVKGCNVEELPLLITYFKTQLDKLGVKVNLGKEVNRSLVEDLKPDVVILADGGSYATPEIKGINNNKVVSSKDIYSRVRSYLRFFSINFLRRLTNFYLPLGKTIVIIGGGIQGCQLAEFLGKRGRKVTIVESTDALTSEMVSTTRKYLLRWLRLKGVTMFTNVKFEEITDKGLTIKTKDGKRQTIEADNIIPALPLKPNNELFQALKDKVPEIYQTGDYKKPHLIIDAIADGAFVGRKI